MQREQLTHNRSKRHFTSQLYTHSRNESPHIPTEKKSGRKASCSNFNNFLNIDQLVEDVKITQIKQNKYTVHIENIVRQLQLLKGLPIVKHQVSTIELLLDTINRKVSADSMSYSRGKSVQTSLKKPTPKKYSDLQEISSPIREISDGSSIAYTKFSLKEIENLSHQQSKVSYAEASNLETPKKSIIYEESNREIQQLNNQILMLQKLLKNKGVEEALQPQDSFTNFESNHKQNLNQSGKQTYKQSENLCPPYRKKLIEKYKGNNSKENMSDYSRQGKIKVTQSKIR